MNFSTFLSSLVAGKDRLGLAVTHQVIHPSDLPEAISAKEILINAETAPSDAIEALRAAVVSGAWVLVHLEDGALPGAVYNQLRNIATMGHLQINGVDGVVDTRCPEEMRVLVIVTPRAFSMIPVPTFINLFGPVYRAEG